jgi:hypothetical protein
MFTGESQSGMSQQFGGILRLMCPRMSICPQSYLNTNRWLNECFERHRLVVLQVPATWVVIKQNHTGWRYSTLMMMARAGWRLLLACPTPVAESYCLGSTVSNRDRQFSRSRPGHHWMAPHARSPLIRVTIQSNYLILVMYQSLLA